MPDRQCGVSSRERCNRTDRLDQPTKAVLVRGSDEARGPLDSSLPLGTRHHFSLTRHRTPSTIRTCKTDQQPFCPASRDVRDGLVLSMRSACHSPRILIADCCGVIAVKPDKQSPGVQLPCKILGTKWSARETSSDGRVGPRACRVWQSSSFVDLGASAMELLISDGASGSVLEDLENSFNLCQHISRRCRCVPHTH